MHHSTLNLSVVSQLKRQLKHGQDPAFVKCQLNHSLWGLDPCTRHGYLNK